MVETARRKCGECTFCCTALGIGELNKPGGRPCQIAVTAPFRSIFTVAVSLG